MYWNAGYFTELLHARYNGMRALSLTGLANASYRERKNYDSGMPVLSLNIFIARFRKVQK
jgi:hypothetical protein